MSRAALHLVTALALIALSACADVGADELDSIADAADAVAAEAREIDSKESALCKAYPDQIRTYTTGASGFTWRTQLWGTGAAVPGCANPGSAPSYLPISQRTPFNDVQLYSNTGYTIGCGGVHNQGRSIWCDNNVVTCPAHPFVTEYNLADASPQGSAAFTNWYSSWSPEWRLYAEVKLAFTHLTADIESDGLRHVNCHYTRYSSLNVTQR